MTSPWAEVADRVWIRRYEPLDQTIGVIGGEMGLVVIDTRATHRLADELCDELRQLPGRLVAVVNTHGHWDHAFGNARFSPTPIWGHVRCRAMVLERGEEVRARLIEEFSAEADDFREVVLTPPTDLFEEEATLELGDRQVELRYLGRGHTDNDIVITLPDASVLFAGDLLENAPAPAFGDSYPIAWAETGRTLLTMIEGTVVPGHGDPFDVAFAERQVGELASLAALGGDVVKGGIGLDEAVGRSPFSDAVTRQAFARIRLEMDEH
ncbi:MAG TPA: MBL fold metallo-hydrolase [Candidatus Limnocylindria bacterium]|nr:MBL fold metallo-hydrolase [Candidatus Limnocylindria bacterium]